ncbi:hypothetical protein J5S49_09705 [Virgibacillus halodenitrificans]|uniref:Uncharacterized protein n=1 Tax=Virgibacillus halodenitrificans TaxID=1482 RepID=A0AAC9IYV5_VIRHA|nr:hypothetical protein [Virgibacillus halodenitrificans]APC47565.1 hypothetical protein BME96_05000 [Virgibacillus halodenitrificans]MCG1028567.1 hypothetical protein [Virgibacillus halodenitrificans]
MEFIFIERGRAFDGWGVVAVRVLVVSAGAFAVAAERSVVSGRELAVADGEQPVSNSSCHVSVHLIPVSVNELIGYVRRSDLAMLRMENSLSLL